MFKRIRGQARKRRQRRVFVMKYMLISSMLDGSLRNESHTEKPTRKVGWWKIMKY